MPTTVKEKQLSVWALGEIKEDEAIPLLVEFLNDKKSFVRSFAAIALGNLGEKAATEKVLDSLIEALKDKESFVRHSAAEALGRLGEKAATNLGIDALRKVFDSELVGEWSKVDAKDALRRIAMREKMAMPRWEKTD
jgi:HEAT repeat protein